MKLFLRRDTSSEGALFTVYDDLGKEKYYVISKKSKVKSGFVILDSDKNIAARIHKIPLVGTNLFDFKVNKKHITFVCLPIQNGINCYFYGNNWRIIGDAVTKNFSIADVDNSIIASQNKNASDYELDIFSAPDELYCISASICINLINTVDNLAAQAV